MMRTAAYYALTAKDVCDLVNADLAGNNWSLGACAEVEKLSKQLAIESGVALGRGKITSGRKVGMKMVAPNKKRGDERAIEGAERELKENVATKNRSGGTANGWRL